jgi:hypothetical protein
VRETKNGDKKMTNEQTVQYGDSAASARAIHSALSSLVAPLPGRRITKDAATWNLNGTLATYSAYEDATLLFTITYSWTADLKYAGSERVDYV